MNIQKKHTTVGTEICVNTFSLDIVAFKSKKASKKGNFIQLTDVAEGCTTILNGREIKAIAAVLKKAKLGKPSGSTIPNLKITASLSTKKAKKASTLTLIYTKENKAVELNGHDIKILSSVLRSFRA